MEQPLDPFAEPPQNVQQQLGESLAASLIASFLSQKAQQIAQKQKGLLAYVVIDIYGGALDGDQAMIDPGAEFALIQGIPHRFCPILTVQRGRETWIPVLVPNINTPK